MSCLMHKFSPIYCPLILASLRRRPIMKKINNITTVAAAAIIIKVIRFFCKHRRDFSLLPFYFNSVKNQPYTNTTTCSIFYNLCRLHLPCQNNVHCPIPHGMVVVESRMYIFSKKWEILISE